MGYYTTAEIVKIVNKLIDRCGTRDPYKVAKELGINIIYRNFDKQRGAYKVILKNRFVFLKNGMHPVVEQIVLWHEIGHDVLHRQEAVAVGGFKEFNIFDMRENRICLKVFFCLENRIGFAENTVAAVHTVSNQKTKRIGSPDILGFFIGKHMGFVLNAPDVHIPGRHRHFGFPQIITDGQPVPFIVLLLTLASHSCPCLHFQIIFL